MYVDEQGKVEINGAEQYVSIRAERENAPLMLYLHGGPGDAALPLVLKFNRALEEHFTVVVWEQRGAGKSYEDFSGQDVRIETFLQDIYALAGLLLKRFGQESLILVGHSWGSVLGIRFIQRFPEMVKAYVGCGQVVNMEKSCRAAYDFALAHGDQKALERLSGIDCRYRGESWLEDLLYVTKQVVKHRGSLYGRTNYLDLTLPFLWSKHYSVSDLICRQKGSLQSIRCLWQELMDVDIEGVVEYEVPVIFIEGRHDSHVSSELAKAYFDTITTEKRFYWFERSCHFPQWTENDKFNRLMVDLLAEGKL